MDFETCKELGVDYMDINKGYIYKIQEYNRLKKLGLPTCGIEVVDSNGNHIGYVQKMD